MATSKAIWDNDEAEETIDGEAALLQDRNGVKSQLQLMPMVDLDASAENRYAKNSSIECGYGRWQPKCLRRCNNPPCLLFFLSMCALTLGNKGLHWVMKDCCIGQHWVMKDCCIAQNF